MERGNIKIWNVVKIICMLRWDVEKIFKVHTNMEHCQDKTHTKKGML